MTGALWAPFRLCDAYDPNHGAIGPRPDALVGVWGPFGGPFPPCKVRAAIPHRATGPRPDALVGDWGLFGLSGRRCPKLGRVALCRPPGEWHWTLGLPLTPFCLVRRVRPPSRAGAVSVREVP